LKEKKGGGGTCAASDDKTSWAKDKPETKAGRFFQPGTCWY
jgi:hypothetical protein